MKRHRLLGRKKCFNRYAKGDGAFMKRLIAIGGSENDLKDLKDVFYYMFKNLPDNPKLIYIPTANNDHQAYSEYMKNFFESNYKAKVDILYLLSEKNDYLKIGERVMTANCIYVEGGNLKLLLNELNREEMKNILVDAYNGGITLAGISAGAMCWFEYGFSDNCDRTSLKKYYSIVPCMSFVKGVVSPHYNDIERKNFFKLELKNNKLLSEGWGIENGSALIWEDGKYSTINNVEHLTSK